MVSLSTGGLSDGGANKRPLENGYHSSNLENTLVYKSNKISAVRVLLPMCCQIAQKVDANPCGSVGRGDAFNIHHGCVGLYLDSYIRRANPWHESSRENMASLLSSWSSNLQSLPANYVVPVEKRPGEPVPISKDIPVIDLGDANRADLGQKIIKASQEFGLFQVINHGVSEKLMIDGMKVGKEFFSLAAEEKIKISSDDVESGFKVYTSTGNYCTQEFAYWKDTLQHQCHPLESCIKTWPDKPARYREIIGPYTVEVRNLGKRLLELIYEGLGFTEEEFDNYDLVLMIHHYPACPDPSSALGAGGHCDGNLITLLQQDVYGLQVLKDGKWLAVEPLPNAFVVNVSFTLEVISNGKLRSAVHRVVTNSECSRISLASFVNYPYDRFIEPAKSVVTAIDPPVFRGFHFKEFMEVLLSKNADTEATCDYFKIKGQASK